MRRFLCFGLGLAFVIAVVEAADKEVKDTPAAAATRKKLEEKISVSYKEKLLREVWEDLKDKVEGIGIRGDLKGGVNQNAKIKFEAKDKTLEDVLNGICDKNDLGWYVISKQNDAYDGTLYFTKGGKERGYLTGQGPSKTDSKDKDKAAKDKPAKDKPAKDKASKDKDPDKDKSVSKDKDKDDEKPKENPVIDEAEKVERAAASKLKAIKGVIEDGNNDRAIKLCKELLKNFPDSKAAKEANEILEKLEKD